MPSLNTCLYNRDLSFLRGIAAFWGLEISAKDAREYSLYLEEAILKSGFINEVLESQPDHAKEALLSLRSAGGVLPWTSFTRLYGEIRPMGPSKFERLKPGIFPASTAELLWYRGLIGRTFIQDSDGLVENAFLPSEFMVADTLANHVHGMPTRPLPASAQETDVRLSVSGTDGLLDQLCWLLSALRRPDSDYRTPLEDMPDREMLLVLVQASGLLENNNFQPTPLAKDFLEKPRAHAFAWLIETWRTSDLFDELRLIPDFHCKGTWQNRPVKPRKALFEFLKQLPSNTWFEVETLIDHFGQYEPDFLRQGTEYDNWMIVSTQPGKSLLRGVSSWSEVEAVYLRFLLYGPFTWFGLIDQGISSHGKQTHFFRRSALFNSLVERYTLPALDNETEKVKITSSGLLEMSYRVPRIARYQISRFCEWVEVRDTGGLFRLTSGSLKQARSQGLLTRHLLALLRKYAVSSPNLTQAILRWEENGQEAYLTRPIILQLANADLLRLLRDSAANKYLGEALSPATVIVKPGGQAKLMGELMRLGIIADGLNGEDE